MFANRVPTLLTELRGLAPGLSDLATDGNGPSGRQSRRSAGLGCLSQAHARAAEGVDSGLDSWGCELRRSSVHLGPRI